MKNIKQIMEETNILIEGMTSLELEKRLKKLRSKNKNIDDIFKRNQLKFITRFFSEFISVDGKYIKNTHLKDLLILYWIDYYLKNHLSHPALKVEKYLNTAIINCHEDKKISKVTSDKENTFGEVFIWFKENLTIKEKKAVIQYMVLEYSTDPQKISNFELHMGNIVSLRNFCLHHYSVVSYQYAYKIKNGERQQDRKAKNKTLAEAIESLSLYLNVKTSNKLIKKIKKAHEMYEFSDDYIKKIVKNKLEQVINMKQLKKIKKRNIHFSVIDLILDRYDHAKS